MQLTPNAKPTSMRLLQQAAADLKEAQAHLENNIKNARRCGNSWEEIGKALRLSKQTTFNRYKTLGKPGNEVQEHHEQTVKFLDGQAPAKPSKTVDTAAPAKPPMGKGTSKKGMTGEPRPSFTLHSAGMVNGVAQPGTGKGPHACPRCGSTNHKSGTPHKIHAYPGECKPTKYDPQDIADVLTNYLKASK